MASAIVALLGALALVAGARWLLPAAVHGPVAEGKWTARSRALFEQTGFHPAELDLDTGRYFSWTSGHAQLAFRHLSRHVAYLVTITIRSSRPAGDPLPVVRVSVDDRVVLQADTATAGRVLSFEIPRSEGLGSVVVIDADPVYIPGPSDKRALGIVVEDVAVAPVRGSFRPVLGVLMLTAVAIGACALALWWLGLRGWLFVVAAGGVGVGFNWLLLTDAAFAGRFPDRLIGIGLAALLAGAVMGLVRLRWPTLAGVSGWSLAAAVVLAVTVVKLGVFWHPLAIVGDGIFQVHRAQAVHAGHYYFTSVTPRPFYEFPYAIALYWTAQPFWSWFPTELDLLRLLRTLSIAADALTAIALSVAARRQWPNSRAPLLIAALYPFACAPMEALSNANLTNLFGQSLFGVGMAAIAWLAVATTTPWMAVALGLAMLTVAFLSHFGTLTVGLCVLGVVAAGLLVAGRGVSRRAGLWVAALAIGAAAVSWFVYYSDSTFRPVYAKTYASLSTRESDNSSKLDAAPGVKLQRWWTGIGDDYGRPGVAVLAATLVGLFLALRQVLRGGPPSTHTGSGGQGVTLVFAFWIGAWLALSGLGIFTSVTLRANLAAAPAFMFFSAVTLNAIADRSRAGLFVAAGVFALLAWDGWQVAVACLALTGAH